MTKRLILLVALVAVSLIAAGYGIASAVNTYTVHRGDTVISPTAKCVVGKHRIDCELRRGRKHITAIIFPLEILLVVKGNVRHACYSSGQCPY